MFSCAAFFVSFFPPRTQHSSFTKNSIHEGTIIGPCEFFLRRCMLIKYFLKAILKRANSSLSSRLKVCSENNSRSSFLVRCFQNGHYHFVKVRETCHGSGGMLEAPISVG